MIFIKFLKEVILRLNRVIHFLIKRIILFFLRFYQICISPLLGKNCRFIPTCSSYTYEAIEIHGIIKGIYLGVKRILKCHPYHAGGYDPVPPKKNKVRGENKE